MCSLSADRFRIDRTLAELTDPGATSVPCLDEDARQRLAAEARRCHYEPAEEVVGEGDRMVRQQMRIGRDIPAGGLLERLARELQQRMEQLLAPVNPYPFETPLHFNETSVQCYETGSVGITPHRDQRVYINLVALFVLAGRGRFYVCADRRGSGLREITAPAGSLILMRAPGFRPAPRRPFHAVDRITETRYVLGLRQRRTVPAHGTPDAS